MTIHTAVLGPGETDLLGRLATVHPGYLWRSDCDDTELSNLLELGLAAAGGRRIWVTPDGLELWSRRVEVE